MLVYVCGPTHCQTEAQPRLSCEVLGPAVVAYAIDSRWRNRSEFVNGRDAIIAFLSRKWAKELNYRLI